MIRHSWLLLVILTITLSSSAFGQFTVFLDAGTVKGNYVSMSDLGTETEVIEHKITTPDQTEIIQKIPGRLKFFNVTLKRLVTSDKKAWEWRKLVEDGKIQEARRNVTLQIRDNQGVPVASWSLVNCWPASITLETANGALEEKLVLVCEGMQRDS